MTRPRGHRPEHPAAHLLAPDRDARRPAARVAAVARSTITR
ncbi:MAG TPA: hypothetical protein VID29_06785 [Solirubrobacteraceae bacterium]